MGSLFSPPKPPAIPMPPPAAHPPTLGSSMIAVTTSEQKRKAAGAEGAGFSNTIETTPEGLKEKPAVAAATLLGQTST